MTQTVHVALGERSYDITLAHGALPQTGAITRAACGSKARRVALISNPKVHGLYGKAVEKSLKQAGFAVLTQLDDDLLGSVPFTLVLSAHWLSCLSLGQRLMK